MRKQRRLNRPYQIHPVRVGQPAADVKRRLPAFTVYLAGVYAPLLCSLSGYIASRYPVPWRRLAAAIETRDARPP